MIVAENGLFVVKEVELGYSSILLLLIAQVSKQNLLWCYTEYPYRLDSSENTQLKAVNKKSDSDKHLSLDRVCFSVRAWLLFKYVSCFVCWFVCFVLFCLFASLSAFYFRENLRIYFESIIEIHKPRHAWFAGLYHYLTNNCNKDLAHEIVDNFKALLLRSLWGPHRCRSILDCQNIKVDVDCGEQTRRRRDTAALLPLSVNFALKVPLSNYSSNTSLDLNETSLQISNDILAALEPAASLNITGVVIVVDTTRPPEIQLTSLICDDGQVLIGTKCGKD